MNLKNLISELKRRNVFKVATAYGIAGWLIIQVSDTVFPRFGFPDWTVTFVITLVFIGLPISLIVAWAFELTPEGLKKTVEVDTEESITPNTGKKLNKVIISVLSIAVMFLLVERIFFANVVSESDTLSVQSASIAVLPFVNMSSDAENEFFSDGLSEELLNALAKIEDMKVAGRTSSFKFKGQNENLSLIAEELGVKYILEGSVRKAGNQVRITAQLIKAEDGYHIWSEAYDRELTTEQIFNIQEEITRHVVEELKVKLLPGQKELIVERATDNLEAYEYFLKASQTRFSFKPDDIEEAIELYQKAIDLDSDYTEAYAQQAISYSMLYSFGNISREYTLEKMKESIDQAVLSDLNSGEIYFALTFYHNLNGDGEKAEEALLKAVELLPNNALVMMAYATQNNNRYRDQVNVERINRAYELDPDHPLVATEYANYLYLIDEFDESMKLIDKVIAEYPDYNYVYREKIGQLMDAPYGELDEAFKIAWERYQMFPEDVEVISRIIDASTSLRMFGLAEEIIGQMKRDLPNNPSSFRQERILYFATKDTTAISEMGTRIEKEFDLDNENGKVLRRWVNYYLAGDYETLIKTLEDANPGLKEKKPDSDLPLGFYSFLLIKAGDVERGREIGSLDCDRSLSRIETQPDETYRVNDNWVRLGCQAVLGEYEEAYKTLRTLHFEQKSKANWDYFNIANPSRQLLYDQPMFDDLVEEIETDIRQMQSNAIEYLKSRSEWKEEWEPNNN